MEVQEKIDPILQNFRQQIDDIDDKIIALLAQRMAIILQVAEHKKNNSESFFIRSAREADMIKALVKKSPQNFPPATIVALWRKIIAVANMCEQKISIAIHNPKNIPDLNYLVSEYYSENVPLHNFDSTAGVVSELEHGRAQIAVFILPRADNATESDEQNFDNSENWWIRLANNKLNLRVFAQIPFVEFTDEESKRNQIRLVAVAAKEPEKSSDDNSLLYVESAKEISKNRILLALKEVGIAAKFLKSVKLNQVDGVMFHLLELDGFYLDQDKALQAFAKTKNFRPYMRILGHYAKPIKLAVDK